MTNIIADMVLDLINGGENWKRELSIMTKEEKTKALEEMISMYQNVPDDRKDYIQKISEDNNEDIMETRWKEFKAKREKEFKEAREEFMKAFNNADNLGYENLDLPTLPIEEVEELMDQEEALSMLEDIKPMGGIVTKEEVLASKHTITNKMKETINSTKHLIPSDQMIQYATLRKLESIKWESVPSSLKQIAQEIKEKEGDVNMNVKEYLEETLKERREYKRQLEEEQLAKFAEEEIDFDKVSQELKDIYEEEKEDGDNFIRGIKCELRRRQEQGKDITIHNCRLL